MKQLGKIIPIVMVMLLYAALLLASGQVEGSAEANKQWGNLGWKILNFTVLVGLLWYLLADKVKTFFMQRRSQIAEVLKEIDAAQLNSEKQFAEYEEKFKSIGEEIQKIKDSMMGDMAVEKQRIIDESQVTAQRIMEQAKTAAQQESIRARQELRNYVVDLSGEMALEIITKNFQAEDQNKIVEDYLTTVAREN